jgi:proteic killer suppression protein
MNISFRSKALRRYWEKNDPRGLNPQHVSKIEQILDMLELATSPEDMNLERLKFHKLTGENPPRWSVWVNGNWRITFSFDGEDAVAIDYEDYH